MRLAHIIRPCEGLAGKQQRLALSPCGVSLIWSHSSRKFHCSDLLAIVQYPQEPRQTLVVLWTCYQLNRVSVAVQNAISLPLCRPMESKQFCHIASEFTSISPGCLQRTSRKADEALVTVIHSKHPRRLFFWG